MPSYTIHLPVTLKCEGCTADSNRTIEEHEAEYWWCRACLLRYPASLVKAHNDPYQYGLEMATGHEVLFAAAHIEGDWVSIGGVQYAINQIVRCWQVM